VGPSSRSCLAFSASNRGGKDEHLSNSRLRSRLLASRSCCSSTTICSNIGTAHRQGTGLALNGSGDSLLWPAAAAAFRLGESKSQELLPTTKAFWRGERDSLEGSAECPRRAASADFMAWYRGAVVETGDGRALNGSLITSFSLSFSANICWRRISLLRLPFRCSQYEFSNKNEGQSGVVGWFSCHHLRSRSSSSSAGSPTPGGISGGSSKCCRGSCGGAWPAEAPAALRTSSPAKPPP